LISSPNLIEISRNASQKSLQNITQNHHQKSNIVAKYGPVNQVISALFSVRTICPAFSCCTTNSYQIL